MPHMMHQFENAKCVKVLTEVFWSVSQHAGRLLFHIHAKAQ